MEKIKVVLIDDERIVLNGIKALLKRESNLELVGAADNGLDGLSLVLDEKPEIVLTDIRMPGMSGLELIRKAKEELPNTVFIIFSGYNEFQYVKEAIGLGVIDYLEKPVTIDKLRGAIDKGIQSFHYHQNYTKMARRMERTERVCVERALHQAYGQSWEQQAGLKEILEQNSQLEYAKALCVMKLSLQNTGSEKLYALLFHEPAQEHQLEVYIFSEYESMVLVYFIFHPKPFDFMAEAVRCQQCLESEMLHCYIGVSRVHEDFYQLRTAFTEADDALRYACYLEETNIVGIDRVEYTTSVPRDLNKNQNSISFNFRAHQYDLCREQVRDYLNHLKSMDLLPELLQQKCMELLYSLNWLLHEMDRSQNRDVDLIYPAHRRSFSADELIAWALERVNLILHRALEAGETEKNSAVEFAKRYIDQHFREGISLDTIAERVNMSPTYLSMLFKREEGITYIHYLTKVRMEKAEEYIRQGHKAKDVCEMVGYYDYKHFSAQFKTYAGMTLETYKRRFSVSL